MRPVNLNVLAIIPLLLCALSAQAASPSILPVTNTDYQEECGACHFAFQPGLLPSASWQKLMADLHDHFGENAELGVDAKNQLTDYLVANAADRSPSKRSARIVKSIISGVPLRITDVPYIRKKHHEVPIRMIQGNDKVRSLANCDACHTEALKGIYSENSISIPGYGRWED